MKRVLVMTTLFLSITLNSFCQELENDEKHAIELANGGEDAQTNEWDLLISAIMEVESRHIKDAYNKDCKCAGILQITPTLVAETNRISSMKKLNRRYSLDDRFDIDKSVEMFNIIQDFYNSGHDIERAIRLWNGGPGYSTKRTQTYYKKVMDEFNKLKTLNAF